MNNISIIIEAFENRIGQVVCSINKFENVPNNQVYQINTKDKAYIFKIYDQRDWPEDGKLHFIESWTNVILLTLSFMILIVIMNIFPTDT